MKKPWTSLLILLLILSLVGIGLFSGRFMIYLTIRVMLLGIFALGYNLLLGRTGLLSFGHGAFYAAGAYGLGFFSLHLTSHPLLGILIGVLVAALLALVIGFFCVRHTEIYFAMLTLAFGMMVFSLIWNLRDFTGGDDGLVGIIRDTVSFFGLFKISIKSDKQYYFLVLAFFLLSAWIVHRLQNSPFGLALAGIRENPNRSEFAGVDVKNYRLTVFVISGAFAGLAGALETLLESNARPFMAHWSHSAEPILVSLLGGILSFAGPLVGSVFFIAMREIIQRFTENWMLWFGVVLLIVIMGFRGGVVGVIEGLTSKSKKELKE
jgi:branched-chain amino acid transport system permease protein